MCQSGSLTRAAVEVPASPPQRPSSKGASHRELELKLAALQKDYADLRSALFEASRTHQRLCAQRLVQHGDFEIASEIFAARYLPGDFFTIEKASGGVILALGDICGKGLAAGMWTPYMAGLIRAFTATGPDPQAIVTAVNREVCRMSTVAPLVSLFLATLDPETGRLDYCCAGHPPTLLLRADGPLESLAEGGMLLGVLPTASFTTGSVEVQAGDILLAYSDGILELRNDEDEEFSHERLEAQLRRAQSGSAESVLFSVLGAVQDFAAARPQADDMSLVVVHRRRQTM